VSQQEALATAAILGSSACYPAFGKVADEFDANLLLFAYPLKCRIALSLSDKDRHPASRHSILVSEHPTRNDRLPNRRSIEPRLYFD